MLKKKNLGDYFIMEGSYLVVKQTCNKCRLKDRLSYVILISIIYIISIN